jgi:hypothetical protein
MPKAYNHRGRETRFPGTWISGSHSRDAKNLSHSNLKTQPISRIIFSMIRTSHTSLIIGVLSTNDPLKVLFGRSPSWRGLAVGFDGDDHLICQPIRASISIVGIHPVHSMDLMDSNCPAKVGFGLMKCDRFIPKLGGNCPACPRTHRCVHRRNRGVTG